MFNSFTLVQLQLYKVRKKDIRVKMSVLKFRWLGILLLSITIADTTYAALEAKSPASPLLLVKQLVGALYHNKESSYSIIVSIKTWHISHGWSVQYLLTPTTLLGIKTFTIFLLIKKKTQTMLIDKMTQILIIKKKMGKWLLKEHQSASPFTGQETGTSSLLT